MEIIKELEYQIELTNEVIEIESYRQNWIKNDTDLIIKNQLVIMNTLKNLLNKFEDERFK